MRRVCVLVSALVCASGTAPAQAADDYPVCAGETSAASVQAKGGPLLRMGITPRVQAGQVGPTPATAKPEDVPKTMAALARLRPPAGPLVIRLNRFFWSDGEDAFTQFLAEAKRYTDAGYLVELQVRYHPSAEQEGDIAGWTGHVRDVVDRFGANPGVVGLQITNEVNFDFSADSSDGAYQGGKDALIQGVIAAKDEARAKGFSQLTVGFNWAYRYDPQHEQAFWDYLRDNGGQPFLAALDWVGLDAYPGTFFPPAEQSVDDYRDGMVNGMSSFRCYLRAAGIPDTVPMHLEENGWPTFGTRREEMQAQVADRMIRAVNDFRGTYNVSDYRWFNLRDANSSDPAVAQHYGLMRDDYTYKAAFAVVAGLFHQLSSTEAPAAAGCLPKAGPVTRRGIGPVRLGANAAQLAPPSRRSKTAVTYCIRGGGRLIAALDRRGRVRLVRTTSLGSRVRSLRVGSSLRAVKRKYPHGLRIAKRLIRATRHSRVVFGTCACGSVRFIAVTDAGNAAKIRYYARRAR